MIHPLSALHALIEKRATPAPDLQYSPQYVANIQTITKEIAQKIHTEYKPYLEETIIGGDPLYMDDQLQLQYYFNSINFCYWPLPGKEKWNILNSHGEKIDGSEAMLTALERAHIYSLTPREIQSITIEKFVSLLGGKGDLQLIPERLKTLKTASVLLEQYEGRYSNIIQKCEYNAVTLLDILIQSPAFYDATMVEGEAVPFLKRAQLLVKVTEDVLPQETSLQGLDTFTAFSDYKVPQVLETLGLLSYAPDLRQQLDTFVLVEKDSATEASIRLLTVYIIEDIRIALAKLGVHLISPQIDSLLWNLSNKAPYNAQAKPYHRTITTAY